MMAKKSPLLERAAGHYVDTTADNRWLRRT